MKKSILLFSALFLLFNSVLKGQNNAPPLPQRSVTLSPEMDLNFGDVLVEPNKLGSISISSTNVVYCDNTVSLQIYSMPHRAEVSFHLCPGRSITISWTDIEFDMTSPAGAPLKAKINSVSVNNQQMTNGQTFFSDKGCNDTHRIYVGGILFFQSLGGYAGSYQGNFEVKVNYQ